MTGELPAAEWSLLDAAYGALTEAMLRLDRAEVGQATVHLLEAVSRCGEDAGPVAAEIALELFDAWAGAEDIVPDEPSGTVDEFRSVVLGVLVRLGDAHPAAALAPAYELAGAEVSDSDPVAGIALIERAVELADSDGERAGYLVSLALACAMAGELDRALDLAERASASASDDETRDAADEVLIEAAGEIGSSRGVQKAMELLAEPRPDLPAGLGSTIIAVLIREAALLEARDEVPTAELAGALRRGLARPDWVPEPLTMSDFAVLVAWNDLRRDDLTRLEETMVVATGPFSHADTAAHAALLRFMVAFLHADMLAMEELLRAAAPLVEASGEPGTVTAFRGVVTMLEWTRNAGSGAAPELEWGALQASEGRQVGVELGLFMDSLRAIRSVKLGEATAFPPMLRARLDAWCAEPVHAGVDPWARAMVWMVGLVCAELVGDRPEATRRLERYRECRAVFGDAAPQTLWMDLFIDGAAPGLSRGGYSAESVLKLTSTAERYRGSGFEFAAFVLDVQLALLQLDRDPREALSAAVRALAYRQRHLSVLHGSSDRLALREFELETVRCALRAAARIGDDRLFAELLEFLRAQEMPEVPEETDRARLPLAMLVPPATFGDRGQTARQMPTGDSVTLAQARRVRMPWGGLALSSILPPADDAYVDLVVPMSQPTQAGRTPVPQCPTLTS